MIKGCFKKALNVDTAVMMIVSFREYQDWSTTFDLVVPNKFKDKKEQPEKENQDNEKESQ